jgi:hypothetical protein
MQTLLQDLRYGARTLVRSSSVRFQGHSTNSPLSGYWFARRAKEEKFVF